MVTSLFSPSRNKTLYMYSDVVLSRFLETVQKQKFYYSLDPIKRKKIRHVSGEKLSCMNTLSYSEKIKIILVGEES